MPEQENQAILDINPVLDELVLPAVQEFSFDEGISISSEDPIDAENSIAVEDPIATEDPIEDDEDETPVSETEKSSAPRESRNAPISQSPGRRPPRPANVHINVSPRLLEIAEIIAEDSGMKLREYLEAAMTLVLNTHADKLGMNEKKYVMEFTNEKKRPKVRVSR